MNLLVPALFAFALTSHSLLAVAQTPPPPAATAAAISMLQSKGYVIGKSFDAGHGLKGWVVSRAGQPTVVFTTPDGQVLLIGAMVDMNGNNLTQGFVEKYATNGELANVYDDLAKTKFVDLVPKGPVHRVVYIVFDPNCPYCSMTYRALKQYVSSGIEFRWMPVAYLRPDSANRAEAILSAKDPAMALDQNETGFDEAKHEGGIAPADHVSESVLNELKKNDAILQKIGSNQVPTVLWKDDTGHVHQYVGLPPMEAMLDIVGVGQPHP